MYSYNSYHKIITIGLVFLWAIFQFGGSVEDDLVYENGQAKRTGEQLNNLNQGTWTWYYPNGKVELTGKYESGKRIGIWKNFDAKGNLTLERTYAVGKLNGSTTKFNETGDVAYVNNFKNGQKQ